MDRIGGRFPGSVVWLGNSEARVTCYGHDNPLAVYEAACVEGADLDGLSATLINGSDNMWLITFDDDGE